MVEYNKEMYPELKTEGEYKQYILPIIDEIPRLNLEVEKFDFNGLDNDWKYIDEEYPYHNSCAFFVNHIWENLWNYRLNDLLVDSEEFRKAICKSLEQIAFSYFIRSFAEKVKSFSNNKNSAENYEKFNKFLIENKFREFSSKYSVIWYRCYTLISNKIIFTMLVIETVTASRHEIFRKFNISLDTKIQSIVVDGDTHNNGRNVAIITFDDNHKVIFKPRSIDGEIGYSRLIAELNSFLKTNFHSLETLKVGDFGFTSFVEKDDSKQNMVEAGKLACLMYMLNATDMHYSNIIWSIGGAVAIDLETLFHVPRIKSGIPESSKSAYRYIEQSVYSTGILPIKLSNKNGTVDVGFVGIRDKNDVGPIKTIDLVNGFTSDIYFKWNNSGKSIIDNKKRKEIDKQVYDCCENVIKGFTNIYNLILENKEWFKNTVIKIFNDCRLRYIHNMTYRYEQLLRSLSLPEASKNLEFSYDILSRLGILSTTSTKEIVLSECKQIWRGDIPYFCISFNDNQITDSEGVVVGYSEYSPQKQFENKINALSKDDLRNQIRIIKLAFIAKLEDSFFENLLPMNSAKIDNHELIKHLSKKLLDSIFDDRFAHLPKTWIGPVSTYSTDGWAPGVLGYDMYGGRIGIALALAMAGKVLNDKNISDVAFQIFSSSAKILSTNVYEKRSLLSSGLGIFSGFSSVIWGLYEASYIFDKPEWATIAISSWKIIDKEMHRIKQGFFDMMTGNSAAIILRHRMDVDYKLTNDQITEIIAEANKVLNSRNDEFTSGLAHGLAHIIWFFSILYQFYPLNEIDNLVKKCMNIMNEEYISTGGKLNVYRDVENQSDSWCNGISGVLLAYYEGYKAKLVEKTELIQLAGQVKSIRISEEPIFCHGILGLSKILDFLVKNDFYDEVAPILLKIKSTDNFNELIYSYFQNNKARYSLSFGLMSGLSGGIYYLCGENIDFKISPITLESNNDYE